MGRFKRVYTPKYIKKSFKAARIYPLDAKRILYKLHGTQVARRPTTFILNLAEPLQLFLLLIYPKIPSTVSNSLRY